jgi:uncharacterized membrane protein
MVIAQYFVEFIFYSFLGWIWESIYCSINEKKWADRGFLFGPICPIYGSCVVATSALFSFFDFLSSPDFPIWGIFIICYIGSAVAEYATSWVLEKRFHARWWDYSRLPFNINGRICVPVSIAFGLAGVAIVRFLIPAIQGIHAVVPGIVYEILAIIFAAIFGADFALTEASLSALLKDVEKMHQEFNEKAQQRYDLYVKDYVERMSLNQKRIILGISKFTPRVGVPNLEEFHLKRSRLHNALKERIRELRK